MAHFLFNLDTDVVVKTNTNFNKKLKSPKHENIKREMGRTSDAMNSNPLKQYDWNRKVRRKKKQNVGRALRMQRHFKFRRGLVTSCRQFV